jgi:hypothetical protein
MKKLDEDISFDELLRRKKASDARKAQEQGAHERHVEKVQRTANASVEIVPRIQEELRRQCAGFSENRAWNWHIAVLPGTTRALSDTISQATLSLREMDGRETGYSLEIDFNRTGVMYLSVKYLHNNEADNIDMFSAQPSDIATLLIKKLIARAVR